MNILVTGGAGYIGSHACKQLKKHGYTPIAYDNLSRGFKDAVKWGPFVQGDIHNTQKLIETIKEYHITSVLHFAAFAYVGESSEKPELYYHNNVLGSMSLLNAALETGIQNFIFSSTCATYGIPEKTPITEDFPQNPINPYGQTKLMIEQILRDYTKAYPLKAICLRYFNAAGADPDLEIGERHDPETHLIPLVISSALDKNPLKVFGKDYPTKDGTCIRDYIHVTDLAEAHCLALKYLESGTKKFTAINLGTNNGYSVKEIIEATESLLEKPVNFEYAERRVGDPAVLVANNSLATQELKWKPQYTDIKEILKTAISWHKRKL